MNNEYVLGFCFAGPTPDLVVIRKRETAPWNAGLLNGVGGSVEAGEFPEEAMAREFFEETGHRSLPDEWERFGAFVGLGHKGGHDTYVHLFRTYAPGQIEVRTTTDEEVFRIGLVGDQHNRLPDGLGASGNLAGLIALARDPQVVDCQLALR